MGKDRRHFKDRGGEDGWVGATTSQTRREQESGRIRMDQGSAAHQPLDMEALLAELQSGEEQPGGRRGNGGGRGSW